MEGKRQSHQRGVVRLVGRQLAQEGCVKMQGGIPRHALSQVNKESIPAFAEDKDQP